jgi:hypothetical protein
MSVNDDWHGSPQQQALDVVFAGYEADPESLPIDEFVRRIEAMGGLPPPRGLEQLDTTRPDADHNESDAPQGGHR